MEVRRWQSIYQLLTAKEELVAKIQGKDEVKTTEPLPCLTSPSVGAWMVARFKSRDLVQMQRMKQMQNQSDEELRGGML